MPVCSLCGCDDGTETKTEDGKISVTEIDETEWVMTLAQTEDGIAAIHPTLEGTLSEYTDAALAEVTLSARDGVLIISDETGGKSYSGSYEKSEEDDGYLRYTVTAEDENGTAVITLSEDSDGNYSLTLIVAVKNYALSFKENK